MEMFMIRIGNVNPQPSDKRRLSIWISPRDIAQLVSIGIDRPGIRFEIVYGISGNTRAWYDNANAYRLGYKPQDNAEDFSTAILEKEVPGDPIAEMYQGGIFCAVEAVPNPAAPVKKKAKRK
jgi:uronate dehydrogenase